MQQMHTADIEVKHIKESVCQGHTARKEVIHVGKGYLQMNYSRFTPFDGLQKTKR